MIVEYETHWHIALITVNKPEAINAVNHEVATGIEKALDDFEDD